MFEDKYDQLISLIRSSNKDCTIYVSKIVPRGEIDVSAFNHAVMRIVDHWAVHRVKCIDRLVLSPYTCIGHIANA